MASVQASESDRPSEYRGLIDRGFRNHPHSRCKKRYSKGGKDRESPRRSRKPGKQRPAGDD